jgi:hypothetical protein
MEKEEGCLSSILENQPFLPEYYISRFGEVFSIKYNWRGCGTRILKQFKNTDGYPSVRLSIRGKRIHYPVYRLVVMAYLPKRPSEKHETRHLDGNKNNNCVENLAWGTRKENAEDRERHGQTSRGERHSKAVKRGIAGAKGRS